MRSGGRESMTRNEGTPRAWKQVQGCQTRLAGLAWVLLFLLVLPGAARSEALYDLGAWADVQANGEEPGIVAEVYWGFDGQTEVTQYLFLTEAESDEPLELTVTGAELLDTNPFFDDRDDTAVLTYGHFMEEPVGM